MNNDSIDKLVKIGFSNGMTIECENECDGPPITTLTGTVADQTKNRGILSKIWDLT